MSGPKRLRGVRIEFAGRECVVRQTHYQKGGHAALLLVDAHTCEVVTCLTYNLPTFPLEPGHAFIRDQDEHDGMCEVLENAGVVRRTGGGIDFRSVHIPVCKVTLRERNLDRIRDEPQPRLREYLGSIGRER